ASRVSSLFSFTDTATTAIYTLSLHDALPICPLTVCREGLYRYINQNYCTTSRRIRSTYFQAFREQGQSFVAPNQVGIQACAAARSEEHTSELQSRENLVCRLLLEKKKNKNNK